MIYFGFGLVGVALLPCIIQKTSPAGVAVLPFVVYE